ncbi:MAG TPA: hypothetical protein VHE30_17900 [Polyangiaceae bacterium]|nr:hypothetical protein [Polyangiaceae bacterium]
MTLLSATLALAACGPPPVKPPPAAPVLDRPGAAIPGDLDVAIRIDVLAAKRFLGPAAGKALAIDVVDPVHDADVAKFFAASIDAADVIWVALRPGRAPALTDEVVLLRGRFGDLDPPRGGQLGFGPAIDLGGALRLYERPRPERRSAPARIYARSDDWLVFVSEAEVDAVERSLERRAGDAHVDPPDQGIASFSARVPAIVPYFAPEYPLVAEALEAGTRIEGTVDADERGLRFSVGVTYSSDTDAKAAKEHLEPLVARLRDADGVLGALSKSASLEAVGPSLSLRMALDASALDAALRQ